MKGKETADSNGPIVLAPDDEWVRSTVRIIITGRRKLKLLKSDVTRCHLLGTYPKWNTLRTEISLCVDKLATNRLARCTFQFGFVLLFFLWA
jgi:hypothetical protein